MTEPRAEGEAFNIGDSKPLTQVEVVEKLAKAAGADPTLVRMPRDVIAQTGGNAMAEPYYFGEYFDLPPITENMGKVSAHSEDDPDALRRWAERDLPLVHAQPQAAHGGLRVRRPAAGHGAHRFDRQRLGITPPAARPTCGYRAFRRTSGLEITLFPARHLLRRWYN